MFVLNYYILIFEISFCDMHIVIFNYDKKSMLHPQIGCRIGIRYRLIDRFPDRRSFDKEENLGAWCWDHTYKTYDRRVWSSCARVAWFSWLVFSSRFSPEIPTARQHHQPNYRCCFHLWAPDPVELYVLKQNFFPPALIIYKISFNNFVFLG